MAPTPLRSAALCILLICLSATKVTSQEVTAAQVSTTSLVLEWKKTGQWGDVGTYHVKIQANGNPFCETTQYCFLADTCSFSSEDHCGMLPPCGDVVAFVSGGSYTAPSVNVQTAPEAVTDLNVTSHGERRDITWTNPDSSCFAATAASVTYGGYYDYIEVMTPSETSLSVFVCNQGTGFVSLRTRGGDGESDPSSVAIARLTGGDTVSLASCPTEGCTDVTVDWDYEAVCSEVTHFRVTAKYGFDTVTATADLGNTTVTFEDLELDTLYETCVEALNEDDNLLAASCDVCGTYPEVVNELTVVNVTDTTVELAWEVPLCQVDDDIEYKVSYSFIGQDLSVTTTDTSLLFTDLAPATNYTFCVLVQHPDVSPVHVSACISSYTLPAAREKVDVRIYESTSLFVTWPGDLFTPNLMYLVSWGDDLEHSNYTEYMSYTIEGYNQTVGPNRVCVQAELKNSPGKRSVRTCQEQPFATFGEDKPDHTAMIVSVSVSAGLAVLLSVVLLVVAKRQEKHIRDT